MPVDRRFESPAVIFGICGTIATTTIVNEGHSMAPSIGQNFKPGDNVEVSGLYEVVHDPKHTQRHEILCVYGNIFPPCGGCAYPRFKLIRMAELVEMDEHFARRSA
jgi:hypothetical protein